MILTNREDLKVEDLKKYIKYDPDTGQMFRILRLSKTQTEHTCNQLVKGSNNRGYKWLRLHGLMFLAHRLAWFYMIGEHPVDEIDHINGDRQDNRWCNLRQVTPFENSRNQGNRQDNTSGCRGVTFHKHSGKWVARISHKGIRYDLGYFSNIDAAINVRKQAEIDFKYHPNHAARESWVK